MPGTVIGDNDGGVFLSSRIRTVAVIARKGGSGKTTVATHLALAAHARGLQVMLADTDPQRSAVNLLKARTGPTPAYAETSGSKLVALQFAQQRLETDLIVIDTPAVLDDEICASVNAADMSILVVRPTYLDLASALHTAEITRRLRKPAVILLSQAPPARVGIEAPAVQRALTAIQLINLSVVPVILHARTGFQTALEAGKSVEEADPQGAAAEEIRALWRFVDRTLFERPSGVRAQSQQLASVELR